MAETCFGVHLGCTSACIAYCKDDKADVVANDAGDRVTPAVVAFTETEQLVGLAAKQHMMMNPASSVSGVKRFLGRTISDAELENSGPVKVTNVDGEPMFSVMFKQKPNQFSPVDIATVLYRKMMDIAESHGGTAECHDAVLSVPLSFSETQRAATKEAATKAGFNVLRIISEPSATLLAYGVGQKDVSECCNAMVLRVGGQTADVTIMSINSGMYHVCANVNVPDLGGTIIDDLLVEHFAAEFQRQYKKDLRGSSRAVSKLRVAAETCKRVLSTVGAAQCSVDSLYEGIDFNSTLSRGRFEVLCGSFMQRCLQAVTECLNKAEMNRSDIHKVILSGGCCRIPALQKQVQDYFSAAEFINGLAADEAIAIGCAVEAAVLKGRDEQELDLFAVDCDLPCSSADIVIQLHGDETQCYDVIPRLTPVPVRRQQLLTLGPSDSSALVDVLQRLPGSCELVSLAQLSLTDLPEGASLSVTCHFRHDGVLHVTCIEPTANVSQDVLIESA